MTTERYERIPELTLGWRLKMALGDISREQIAEMMDVTPSTISRWMSDKGAPPKRPYLLQWALKTGVPVEWLENGGAPGGGPGPGHVGDMLDRLTQQKRARTRGARNTLQYLPPAAAAA